MNIELERLTKAGLIVKESRGGTMSKFKIFKPSSISGNARQENGFDIYHNSQRVHCSAPGSMIRQEGENWTFKVWIWVPGPGPGDFKETYSSISEVVDAVLDYYFGDSSKMNPPELLAYYREKK